MHLESRTDTKTLKPDLRLIRIGNGERVADGVRPLLIEEQMEQWRKRANRTRAAFYCSMVC